MVEKSVSYKTTVFACYVSSVIMAVVLNITAVMFIPLREEFGLSYSQFGLLVLTSFITQVTVDIAFSKAVDKYGMRPFIALAHIICFIGFMLFAFTPVLFKQNVYTGFLISTIIFSGASGLFELLLNPIIDAIPTKEKDKAMALLHSFYAWGQVFVVLSTTLLIFFGVYWAYILIIWAFVPLINFFLFLKVPIATKHYDAPMLTIRQLVKNPVFIIAFLAILSGGAAEVTIAQWASVFFEKGLSLPKLLGDTLGLCGFAVMLGIGRVVYGVYGEKFSLHKVLIYGSLVTIACYLAVALSPFKWLSVLACVVTGIAVSLMWPGTLVIASEKLPLAGASMFALLAAGGDIGCSIGPSMTGVFTDLSMNLLSVTDSLLKEQIALRIGILCAIIFPIISLFMQIKLSRVKNKS